MITKEQAEQEAQKPFAERDFEAVRNIWKVLEYPQPPEGAVFIGLGRSDVPEGMEDFEGWFINSDLTYRDYWDGEGLWTLKDEYGAFCVPEDKWEDFVRQWQPEPGRLDALITEAPDAPPAVVRKTSDLNLSKETLAEILAGEFSLDYSPGESTVYMRTLPGGSDLDEIHFQIITER